MEVVRGCLYEHERGGLKMTKAKVKEREKNRTCGGVVVFFWSVEKGRDQKQEAENWMKWKTKQLMFLRKPNQLCNKSAKFPSVCERVPSDDWMFSRRVSIERKLGPSPCLASCKMVEVEGDGRVEDDGGTWV